MKLTKERGSQIRIEHLEKEKEVCLLRGLSQVGGSNTKIDGTDGVNNESIKNFKGSSTQVHLTTQKKFINVLNLNENCKIFIELFCGNENINKNNKDRFFIHEIESLYVTSFTNFLDENKSKIIDLIIRNGYNVNKIIYRDTKTDKIYTIDYDEILNKIKNCRWVTKKGGIHLKNENNKTYFHLQREGKKNKKNRYNVLWHIHRNLFLEN